MKLLCTFSIIIFNFVFSTTGSEHRDARKSFLLNSLGYTEEEIPKVSQKFVLPRFLEFLYSYANDLKVRKQSNYSMVNSQVFSAYKAMTKRKSERYLYMSFHARADKLTGYEGCQIILKLKHSVRNNSFTNFESIVCDENIKYCTTISGVDILASRDSIWLTIDINPMLKKWQLLKDKHIRLNISIEFTMKSEIGTQIFVLSGQNKPLLLLINDKMEYERIKNHILTRMKNGRNRRTLQIEEVSDQETLSPTSECSLHNWVVNFTLLGWDQFIIMPETFIANFCAGTCLEPLPDHVTGTNHALIRSLARVMLPDQAKILPPLACYTTNLSIITLLVRTKGKIVMKYNEGMRAESCGCM